MKDGEPAVVLYGFAAKSPTGELDFITAEIPEDVAWELGSRKRDDGWTIVPVEIRELPLEQHEEKG